jgi:hypothetical protein
MRVVILNFPLMYVNSCGLVCLCVAGCVQDEFAPLSRKRVKNSPQNFSVVFKTALSMLKQYTPGPDKKKQPSIKTKRKMGGWLDKCLRDMINIEPRYFFHAGAM